MKRTMRVVLAVALIMIAVGMIIVGIAHKAAKKSVLSFGDKDIVTGTVPISSFTSLEVDNASIDFIIEKGDRFALEYRVPEAYKPEVKQSGKTLSVRQPSAMGSFFNFINSGRIYYKVTVPANAVYDINIDISSGTFEANSVSLSGRIHMTSGKVELENVTFDGKVKIASGTTNLTAVSGSSLDVDMTSGTVNLKRCKYDDFTMEASSGKLNVEDCTLSNVYFDSTSGSAEFDDCYVDQFKYKLTSGRIDLELYGRENEYDYDMTCTSGKIEVADVSRGKSHVVKYGNSRSISGNAVSGNVTVKFEK